MIEIPCGNGRLAVVDSEDAYLSKTRWWTHVRHGKVGYVFCVFRDGGRQVNERIHRIIATSMGWSLDGAVVDHIDRNPLNNSRSNLRLATISQNGCNRVAQSNSKSGIKGVSWCKREGRWRAVITIDGKYRSLGYFNSPEAAARAYAEAAAVLHGEFARTA
jgi:hypothetical protein